MAVEMYLKQFKKKFGVKRSNKNMDRMYAFQLALAESEDIEEKSDREALKYQRDALHTIIAYLKDVLKLNAKQCETLDDMDYQETIELANYVSMRLMGMSDEEIKKAEEEEPGEE